MMSEHKRTLVKGTVLVAMSGGVDSSVTAALLQEWGFRVIGINMKTHSWRSNVPNSMKFRSCCSPADAHDARMCASLQNFPFYVLDVEADFRKHVIDNFIDEYLHGRTPNPCIHCNKFLKLGLLLDKASIYGAEYVATGHYAIVEFDGGRNRWILQRGADRQKDQTYYLFSLTQEQLSKLKMPLGRYTKDQVRDMARQFGLPVSEKEESQEICFIPDNNYKRFLEIELEGKEIRGLEEGVILSVDGRVLGKHEGYARYTIGQRKGLGISAKEPLYVIDIDTENNIIIAGEKRHVKSSALTADTLNWIMLESLREPIECQAQIRYRSAAAKCRLVPLTDDTVRVDFSEPQSAITPGQAVVFYDGDVVIGGGWIREKF